MQYTVLEFERNEVERNRLKFGECAIWFWSEEKYGRAYSIFGSCRIRANKIEFVAGFQKVEFTKSDSIIVIQKWLPFFLLPTVGISNKSKKFTVLFSSFEVAKLVDFAIDQLGAKLYDNYWMWWREQ